MDHCLIEPLNKRTSCSLNYLPGLVKQTPARKDTLGEFDYRKPARAVFNVDDGYAAQTTWDCGHESEQPHFESPRHYVTLDQCPTSPLSLSPRHLDYQEKNLNNLQEGCNQATIDDLVGAMHLMTRQINSRQALPPYRKEMFDGDPLRYKHFIRHFDAYTVRCS